MQRTVAAAVAAAVVEVGEAATEEEATILLLEVEVVDLSGRLEVADTPSRDSLSISQAAISMTSNLVNPTPMQVRAGLCSC